MTKSEAISLLSTCKSTIQSLIFFDETIGFSEDELKILKRLEEVLQAEFLKDNELLETAGYSIVQASLLLGALEYFGKS